MKKEQHFSGDGMEVIAVGKHKCSSECITNKRIIPQISKRCSLSREAINTFGKNMRGKIVGESRDKECWIIIWDGQSSRNAYSKDFIYVELTP